jgi:hypothetical protein
MFRVGESDFDGIVVDYPQVVFALVFGRCVRYNDSVFARVQLHPIMETTALLTFFINPVCFVLSCM